ncbi:MAG: UPF0158 family protein [Ignavibacteria bacterium]|jgi:hypothetical protein|nr:UPF0158 family protein [Ignavibacteria bacterium]
MKNGDKIILTEEQIKSIAEELEAGFKVYLNIETMQTKSILDFDNNYDADTEPWEEDIKEIEENYDKYLEFDKMDSRESFQVMEEFIVTVDDEELRKKLELGLSKSKPFRNFKNIIDDENEYRKNWFAFRSAKYIEFVKEQLERYNNNLHSST